MDGRCKDCKHWGAENDQPSYGKAWSVDRRECHGIMGYADSEDGPVDDLAAVRLSEWGELRTAPDFGCILFETEEAGKE